MVAARRSAREPTVSPSEGEEGASEPEWKCLGDAAGAISAFIAETLRCTMLISPLSRVSAAAPSQTLENTPPWAVRSLSFLAASVVGEYLVRRRTLLRTPEYIGALPVCDGRLPRDVASRREEPAR